jgi:hypothetical protein
VSEISPETRAFLDGVRSLDEPSPGDAARVRGLLQARLTGAATGGLAARAMKWGLGGLAGAVLLAGVGRLVVSSDETVEQEPPVASFPAEPALPETDLAGLPADPPTAETDVAGRRTDAPAAGIDVARRRTDRPAARTERRPSERAAAPTKEGIAAAAPSAHEPAPPVADRGRPAIEPPSSPSQASSPSGGSSLLAEARLLAVAQRALRNQDWAAALRATAEHAERFPQGMLREERLAAEAVALCSDEQLEAGRGVADRLAGDYPASVHIERVGSVCGD